MGFLVFLFLPFLLFAEDKIAPQNLQSLPHFLRGIFIGEGVPENRDDYFKQMIGDPHDADPRKARGIQHDIIDFFENKAKAICDPQDLESWLPNYKETIAVFYEKHYSIENSEKIKSKGELPSLVDLPLTPHKDPSLVGNKLLFEITLLQTEFLKRSVENCIIKKNDIPYLDQYGFREYRSKPLLDSQEQILRDMLRIARESQDKELQKTYHFATTYLIQKGTFAASLKDRSAVMARAKLKSSAITELQNSDAFRRIDDFKNSHREALQEMREIPPTPAPAVTIEKSKEKTKASRSKNNPTGAKPRK